MQFDLLAIPRKGSDSVMRTISDYLSFNRAVSALRCRLLSLPMNVLVHAAAGIPVGEPIWSGAGTLIAWGPYGIQ